MKHEHGRAAASIENGDRRAGTQDHLHVSEYSGSHEPAQGFAGRSCDGCLIPRWASDLSSPASLPVSTIGESGAIWESHESRNSLPNPVSNGFLNRRSEV
jgi:hypothetical protein